MAAAARSPCLLLCLTRVVALACPVRDTACLQDKSARVLDSSKPDAKLLPDVHEAQLVAEAIAAAMSNQCHPDEQLKRQKANRSKSEADLGGTSAVAARAGAGAAATAHPPRQDVMMPEAPDVQEEPEPSNFDVDASVRGPLLRAHATRHGHRGAYSHPLVRLCACALLRSLCFCCV